jgi:hypothetical protein
MTRAIRVVAVLDDGPAGGRRIMLVGTDAPEVLSVPDRPIPPPVDLDPLEGEPVLEVAYRYSNSKKVQGPAGRLHLYERAAGQDDAGWATGQTVRGVDGIGPTLGSVPPGAR